MKKFVAAFMILTMMLAVTSCASRKYGCPANPMGTAAKAKSTNS